MAFSEVGFALVNILFFAAVVLLKGRHDFAPKRLTPAELCAQIKMVRALVMYAMRGAPAMDADVDDRVQDVMLNAWIASEEDRYRPDPETHPERALQGWLWGITYRHVHDYRKSVRLRREVLRAEPPEVPDGAPSADLRLEAEEQRLEMLAALQELPSGQRAVVVARHLDEETMQSIAERLGVPASTLYKWRARGLAALVDALRATRG